MRRLSFALLLLVPSARCDAQERVFRTARAAALATFAADPSMGLPNRSLDVVDQPLERMREAALDSMAVVAATDAAEVAAALPGSTRVSAWQVLECPSWCRVLRGHAVVFVGAPEDEPSSRVTRVHVVLMQRFEHWNGTVSTSTNALIRVERVGDAWGRGVVEQADFGSSVPRP